MRSKVVEAKAAVEKDKFGQMGVLTWLTNQNVRDLKEAVNRYVQHASDPEDDLIKRLVVVKDQLHTIWKELNPS